MTAHWGIPDPAEAKGTPAEIALAFKDAYRMLYQRIGAFHGAADTRARSTELASKAERDRPHARRDREGGRADLMPSLAQRAFSEWLGTAFLLAAVVGSGIMARSLRAVMSRSRFCATRSRPVPFCGADPDIWAGFRRAFQSGRQHRLALRGELPWSTAAVYLAAQMLGGIVGVGRRM